MTPTQLTTLKAAILADAQLAAFPNDMDGAAQIEALLNLKLTPDWWAYKSSEPTASIGGALSLVAFAAMTDANQGQLTRFYTLYPGSFDPRRADVRSFFTNTFSGTLGGAGQATRDAMDALYRRTVTRGERIFATGTGSTGAPGTLGFEGFITRNEIDEARHLA
jgi:hypothetical protein